MRAIYRTALGNLRFEASKMLIAFLKNFLCSFGTLSFPMLFRVSTTPEIPGNLLESEMAAGNNGNLLRGLS